MESYEFQYPEAHEIPNTRLLHDDIPNPPGEPAEDSNKRLIVAQRLAEALNEAL